ncbi:MAG: hypothetical protein F6K22_14400 [Okeania sp. SIO2F4]|uniref:hypothetical protein n=1 Tax=Okeania sp. SIO2F4 TaxID=2607790 RepID=UPI00142CA4E0|nr:hypothetical protein [Okeania sp. SIO2F4]NES03928.1 hypothetical protein [Okeania sp. SIO2F4]
MTKIPDEIYISHRLQVTNFRNNFGKNADKKYFFRKNFTPKAKQIYFDENSKNRKRKSDNQIVISDLDEYEIEEITVVRLWRILCAKY